MNNSLSYNLLQKYRDVLEKEHGFVCHYCGVNLIDCKEGIPQGKRSATVDHKIPKSMGGNGNIDNLVLCCRSCNGKKGTRPSLFSIFDTSVDRECFDICVAMNKFLGIYTVESCCGHGKTPYSIWFKGDLRCLPRLIYYFDGCHCGFYDWFVTAETDCGMSPVVFCLNGPIGKRAYEESKTIAFLLEEEIKEDWDRFLSS